MDGEDLYREIQCPRCGGTVLAVASFCPHCGFVFEVSWFEKISKTLRTTEKPASSSRPFGSIVPALISMAIGAYLLYQGVMQQSIETIVGGLFFFFAAVRSWFSPSKSAGSRSAVLPTSEEATSSPQDPVIERITCENCGTEVASDALACPKCGMKFADQ